MEDKLKEGNFGIMEPPIISSKDLIKVITNMKNGKASGVDGVPAELMKLIIKNEKIRIYITKCFNNALKEDIHEDWLLSRIQ